MNLLASAHMTLVVDNSVPAAVSAARRTYRRRATYRRRRPTYRRRQRRRSYRRSRATTRMRGTHRGVSKFVAAQINPFDQNVDGCKIPDSNTYPSCPIRIEDIFPGQTSDANGLYVRAFLPMLVNNIVGHTAASASTWSWTAAYGGASNSSKATAVAAQFQLVRPVAHGVRITCSGAPTSVTGNLHVAIVAMSDFNKTTWALPTSVADLANAMFYKKYPVAQFTQQSLTVVNKFLDCTSTRYIDPASDGIANSTDVNFQTNGWAVILVCLEGAAATTSMLEVEEVMHFEAIPIATGLDTSTPAAPFNVVEQEAASRLAGNSPAAFADAEEPHYMQEVSNALNRGVGAYGTQFFDRVVVPAATRLGYHAAGMAASAMYNGIMGVTNQRNPSAFETRLM